VADYPPGDPRDQDKDCAQATEDGFWSEI
jgi:hypothetical protein